MNMQDIEFVELNSNLKNEFLEMAEDYQFAEEERFKLGLDNFEQFLKHLEEHRTSKNLADEYVPYNTFFLMVNGKMVGSGSLRHRLNKTLAIYGGHIGYAVRPTERQKGYGSLILRLLLQKAKEFGFQKVFVTCDTDNTASVKIIEKNRGWLEKRLFYEPTGKTISQYWIDLQ